MRVITVEEAKRIAARKNLKPGRVKGTTRVQFTNGRNGRLEVLDWTSFTTYLRKRNLRIFEHDGYMKIMK